jgi:hypothetical protein
MLDTKKKKKRKEKKRKEKKKSLQQPVQTWVISMN